MSAYTQEQATKDVEALRRRADQIGHRDDADGQRRPGRDAGVRVETFGERAAPMAAAQIEIEPDQLG